MQRCREVEVMHNLFGDDINPAAKSLMKLHLQQSKCFSHMDKEFSKYNYIFTYYRSTCNMHGGNLKRCRDAEKVSTTTSVLRTSWYWNGSVNSKCVSIFQSSLWKPFLNLLFMYLPPVQCTTISTCTKNIHIFRNAYYVFSSSS